MYDDCINDLDVFFESDFSFLDPDDFEEILLKDLADFWQPNLDRARDLSPAKLYTDARWQKAASSAEILISRWQSAEVAESRRLPA